ncbi:MAG: hypothetical protein HC880_19010 [Bacteroidia bacterium]|nr:hypothetical protein [Bacteroidia bacterium]
MGNPGTGLLLDGPGQAPAKMAVKVTKPSSTKGIEAKSNKQDNPLIADQFTESADDSTQSAVDSLLAERPGSGEATPDSLTGSQFNRLFQPHYVGVNPAHLCRRGAAGFSYAMLVGIIFGTYSSIFVASPVVLDFRPRGKVPVRQPA